LVAENFKGNPTNSAGLPFFFDRLSAPYFLKISDYQQSMAPAPSRGFPHVPSWWSLIVYHVVSDVLKASVWAIFDENRNFALLIFFT